MPTLPDPELDREAPAARQKRAALTCASAALGLLVLSTGPAAHAQVPQAPPAASAPAATPVESTQAPPASPTEAAPPPAPPQAPPPPAWEGAPQPGYGPPPAGYGPPPPGGEPGQPPPGYGPPPQGYPYYGPYYGPYYPELQPVPRYERKSTGMMVGGILLSTAGIIGLLAGTAVASTAANQIPIYCSQGGFVTVCETRADTAQQVAGFAVMITGILAIGVGVPLWVIGSKRVPVKTDEAAPAQEQPQTSLRMVVGPSAASLQLSF